MHGCDRRMHGCDREESATEAFATGQGTAMVPVMACQRPLSMCDPGRLPPPLLSGRRWRAGESVGEPCDQATCAAPETRTVGPCDQPACAQSNPITSACDIPERHR
eukprot:3863146-Prymnesium_polylepis.1